MSKEKILDDRYVFQKKLGAGTGGNVYYAYDIKLDKYWAVKECHQYSANEVKVLRTLDYYAFPRIVDTVIEDGYYYLVMDYIEGQNLAATIDNHRFEPGRIIEWCIQIASALDVLHKFSPQMIYMDCKPSNIILTENDDIRMVDMGSIYICDSSKAAHLSGTAYYAPDELKHSLITIPSVETDIYCFGMTMYHLFCGRPVISKNKKGKLIFTNSFSHSSAIEACIQKCTDPNPQKRYHDMKDIIADLTKIKQEKSDIYISCKTFLSQTAFLFLSALSVIVSALYYRFNINYPGFIVLILSSFVFLTGCLNNKITTLEKKKEVYRGMGKRILLQSFSIIMLTSMFVNAYADRSDEYKNDTLVAEATSGVLDITLYDEYGRKILIKQGSCWDTTGDIRFSIPADELGTGPCSITISCQNSNSKRSYSFFAQNID